MPVRKSTRKTSSFNPEQLSFVHVTEIEKAYIAGLFDGEGSVCVARSSTPGEKHPRGVAGVLYEKHQLAITIVNTSVKALEKVHRLYNGRIYQQSRVKSRKQTYVWRINGHKARRFLEDMQRYVIIKAEQVELALNFLDLPRWAPDERRRLYEEMSAINGKRNFGGHWRESNLPRASHKNRKKRGVPLTVKQSETTGEDP